MQKQELGIYIHIPFCKQKCAYCDFVSYQNKHTDTKTYIEALIQEIKQYDVTKYNITTIYIGGGTPSFIESKYIVAIVNALKDKLSTNETKLEDMEITLELNPGTIDKEKLETYKKVGINRLSIGLQSTNDKLLKQLGRIHSYAEFLEAYQLAKNVGFENINVDLMIGLPNQTIADIKESLDAVNELEPNHISVYSLIVEEGTKLEKQLEEEIFTLPDEELERQMYWYVKNKLELYGYEHYEISNFAKPNKVSKHNTNCWAQKEYIGLGLASHSYLNNIRYSNTTSMGEYCKLNEGMQISKIQTIHETQSMEDKKKEYMLLGLRKIEGVSISEFKKLFVDNPVYLYYKELETLVKDELVEIDLDTIKLTNKGIDFANMVWEKFI